LADLFQAHILTRTDTLTAITDFYYDNKRLVTTFFYVAAFVLLALWLQPIIAEQKVSRMLQSTITGLLIGGVYSLIALGIVLINKASGVFNFAHGYMMLLGGLIFYSFYSTANVSPIISVGFSVATVAIVITMNGLREILVPRNLAIGAVATVVFVALLSLPGNDWQLIRAIVGSLMGAVLMGLAIERFTIRPLIGQPLFTAVLMTLAIGEGLLLGITQLLWGSVEIPLQVFASLRDSGLPSTIRIDQRDLLGGLVIIRTDLLITFVLALATFAVFVLFFRYTNVGLAMRATSEDQQLAQSVGLRVRFILAFAWAIAAIGAMVTGVLQGGATSLSLNMPLLALRAFPAVLLGGLESVSGALVGGLVIGLVQEWANLLFPGTQAGTELAPYLVLMIVLVIRPDGLFGEKRIERI
jgi:branched-chain amino acid transport system permease protein